MTPTPDLSLIVLGFRDFDRYTRACLESLRSAATDARVELLVIDNGSGDGSAEKCADWCGRHPGFRFLPSEENLGFAGGMNFGATAAHGRWLVLVNNDTLFPEGAVKALLAVCHSAPENVAVLCPVTNAAGNGQRLWLPGKSNEELLQIGSDLMRHPTGCLMPTYRSDFFCVAIRRDVWSQLGGLDTGFGLGYYEDFDFSLRVREAGHRQMITEDVFVLHVGSASFKGSPEQKTLLRRNKALLKGKHPEVRFEHARQGNLAVLREYQRVMDGGQWTDALQKRLPLRLAGLAADVPRSPLKQFLWRLRIRNLPLTRLRSVRRPEPVE